MPSFFFTQSDLKPGSWSLASVTFEPGGTRSRSIMLVRFVTSGPDTSCTFSSFFGREAMKGLIPRLAEAVRELAEERNRLVEQFKLVGS